MRRGADLEDQAWVDEALKGNVQSFNRLVLKYQDTAYNVAYRILSDPDEAADAVQDSFIKAFKRLGQLHGGSFKAWLLRIVTNSCYDRLRKKKRHPTVSMDASQEDGEPFHQWPSHAPSPEEMALRHETEQIIQRGISQLPPEQRTVLVLSDIEGLSYKEIAEVTQVPIGTVRSRLARARARMRKYLQEEGIFPGK